MTRIPAILLAALLALWGVVIYATVSPDDVYPGAVTHPQQSEMHVAGPAAEYDARMIAAGTAAGVLVISVLLLCLLLGSGKNGASPQFVGIVVVVGSLLLGVFLAMTSAMGEYIRSPSPNLIGGFPVPTAWMVFGVWLTPVLFLVVYVAGFRRWVMTEDDQRRLETLVAQRQAADETTIEAGS